MPACAMLFFRACNRDEKKKTGILYLITVAATTVITVLFSKVVFPGWSIYETLACVGMAAVVLAFAAALIGRQVKLSADPVLKLLCAISVITAVYSILTYGQSIMDSDTAMVSLLNKCRLDQGKLFPESWYYANGDVAQLYGVNTYTTTLPFMLLLKNQSLARMLGSAVFLIVVIFGLYYFSKKVFENSSWTLMTAFVCVFVIGQMHITLFQGAYIGYVFTMCVISALVYEGLVRKKKLPWVFYFILSTLGFTGSLRFFAENAIPLLCAVIFLLFFNRGEKERISWKDRKKELVTAGVLFLSSLLIGQGIYRWLAGFCNANNSSNNAMMFVESLEKCYPNLITYITNLYACFGYGGSVSLASFRGLLNLLSLGVCTVVCFVIPVLQAKRFKEESAGVQFFFVFGIIHNTVLMIVNVFTVLIDYPPRYVLSSVFVWVIISCRYAYVYWFKGKNATGRIWTAIMTVAVIMQCVYMVSLSNGWQTNLAAKKSLNQMITEHGLTKGYATYWNAYNNEIYSDFNISYGGIEITDRGFLKYLWLVDSDVFLPTAETSFLMLSEGENQGAMERIVNQFGPPAGEMEWNGYHIYLFDYDIGSKLKEKNRYTLDEFCVNEAVKREDEQLRITKGGIVFGPAVFIESGEYEACFIGDKLNVCGYDIHSNSAQSGIHFTEEYRSEHEIRVKLSIQYNIGDIELRTWNDSSEEEIILKDVYIK